MDNVNDSQREKIMRFIDKEMTAAEQVAFENELQHNNVLQKETRDADTAGKAVMLYGISREVRTVREAMLAEKKGATFVQMAAYKKWLRFGIAAACAVLVLFTINILNRDNATDLYNEAYQRFEPAEMRGNDTVPSPGEAAYKRKDYKTATAWMVSAVNPAQRELMIAGAAYLENNEPAAAAATFKKLLLKNAAEKTTVYNDAAGYYLALSLLQNSEYKNAADLMSKIAADKENVYHDTFTADYIQRVRRLAGGK